MEQPEVRVFGDDDLVDAIDHNRTIVAGDPTDADALQALFYLWRHAGESDRAWCIAGVLIALDKSGKEETGQFVEYRRRWPLDLLHPLDHQLWLQCIKSDQEDERLGQMCSIVYQTVAPELPLPELSDFGLHARQDKLDIEHAIPFFATVRQISRILAIPPPDIYLDQDATGVSILPMRQPALRVGPELLEDVPEAELAFYAAKYLTYMHPWHLMAAICPEDRLADLLCPLANFLDASDVETFHRAVELTANRAGILLAGDVAASGRVIKTELRRASRSTADDILRDFVRYVASEPHMIAREMIAAG